MKTVKVSIIDENTLSLLEDANKGDIISLKDLHERDIDKSNISDVVKARIQADVEAELKKLKAQMIEEKEKDLKVVALQKEKELKEKMEGITKEEYEKYKNETTELKVQLEKLTIENNTLKEQNKKDVEIATKTIESRYQKDLTDKEYAIKKLEDEKQTIEENIKNKMLLEFNEKENNYKSEIVTKNREIDLLKDMRLKQSTKMLGETLEKHCDLAFEQIRLALPETIQFGKDTDAKEGSMGDRIYREFDNEGNEILSIMFEMKNEADETKTKHKNEDFFKELDKDRNQKKCEYAVLVSLLEKDNDMYDGIYTVPPTKYKDMFVVRPQDFTKIIMWLRGVNAKIAATRTELEVVRNYNIDVSNFETKFNEVRDKFGKHYSAAVDKHNSAVDEIDKIIKQLTKMREFLTGSDRQLKLALNDLDDLTVKKLAKNRPSILALASGSKEKTKNRRKKANETGEKNNKN